MRILVTGGTGYIGSHTAVELIQAGHKVEILDNLFNSKIEVLDYIKQIAGKKPKFYQVDLLDREALDEIFAKTKYDAVIHFAGLKAVGESVQKPLEYYKNNIDGTVNLLQSMQAHGVKKIIFSSSATVYGIQESPEYIETMTTGGQLSNPYGRTKYFIEEIMKDLCVADSEFEVALLRYFNPIGAHPSGLLGEDPNGIPNNLMPIVMQVARGQREKLGVYGDDYPTKDGTCRRDYIHVVDLAKGHMAMLDHMKPGVSIYNLGSGEPNSVKEIIAAFEKASDKELPYEVVGRRAGDLPEFWANPSKAKTELDWQTELTIDDAMIDTLNYLKNTSSQVATNVINVSKDTIPTLDTAKANVSTFGLFSNIQKTFKKAVSAYEKASGKAYPYEVAEHIDDDLPVLKTATEDKTEASWQAEPVYDDEFENL